jgi:lipopolysaccharide transport system ATP-binding protein
MTRATVRVEQVGKCYHIERSGPRHGTLREMISDTATRPIRALRRRGADRVATRRTDSSVWALRNVSFDVHEGEVVGLIGRNGAGKSTLLKIIARITSPTEGRAGLRGRVGSLLEVGTGFHPELSGRDNIYLAGTVLGMRRFEIDRKFDEIVAFAEIERFVDEPVKHYSSGMYMRLAFAVAAHLEPEILLVDEVLAVGDIEFQKRCIGKLQDVSQLGRTVLFVSHSMPAILRLCPRVVLLDGGQVAMDGPAPAVTEAYIQSSLMSQAECYWPDPLSAPGDEVARIRAVRLLGPDGAPATSVDIQQPLAIEVEYWNLKDGAPLIANLHLYDQRGVYLFAAHDNLEPTWGGRPKPAGLYRSVCWLPGNFLNSGRITVHAAVTVWNPHWIHVWVEDAVSFEVVDTGGVRGDFGFEGRGPHGDYAGPLGGALRPYLQWETQRDDDAGPADGPEPLAEPAYR